METVKLKTNIHCESCVAEVKTVFDADKRIRSWAVDTFSSEKLLTVEGNVTESEVISLVEKAGYKVQTSVPFHAIGAPAKSDFWSDRNVWKRASFNTLNCLIGCSIGDFSSIIYLQAYHPNTPMWLQMTIATIAGLSTSVMLETFLLHKRENMVWGFALKTAFGMSFISMVTMEIAMNLSDFMVTGGKAAFSSPAYWLAFIPAAIAGFLAPLPYNYYKLKKYNKACH
jgi:copper chaperone CopZ